MKLKTRVFGGMLCVFLISVALGIFASIVIGRIQAQSRELDIYTALDHSVNEVMVDVQVWRYELLAAIIFEQDFTNSLHVDHSAYGVWRDSPNAGWVQNDPVIDSLIRELDETNRLMHEATLSLIIDQRSGVINILFLTQDLYNTVLPLADRMVDDLQALSARYRELVQQQADSVWHFQNDMILVVLLVCLAGVVVFLIISNFITRSVVNPIKAIRDIVSDVISGNLNVNINRTNLVDDEIGALTGHMCELVDTVKGITIDLTGFNKEYAINGDIDYRIDTKGYRGSYLEIVSGINELGDTAADDMHTAVSVLEAIGNGNFDMTVKRMPGKKIKLNNAIDEVLKRLYNVEDGINTMVESAAVKGELKANIDESAYKGDWRKIIKGLNDIAHAVDEPISEIKSVMEHMGQGFLDKKVEGNYAGDFLAIKDTANDTIQNLSNVVNEVSDTLASLASGDLTFSIAQDYRGDFSAIKESINNISRTLHKTMSEISSASDQVLSSAKQISSSAMNLAEGATEQAGSVDQLHNSIDLINSQTKQNNEYAQEASAISNKSTRYAQEGNDAMQQMLEAMMRIKDSSNSISRINKVIQDIAFQTNLLALNAAVEAARAGEHGKGFAVVAEEVRNLASRSQAASTETTSLIEDSINRVESGSSVAESTAESLNSIVSSANEVLEIINSISESSREQRDAIGQVSEGIGQISMVVQSNSAASEETAAASEELTSQAELLKQLVGYFKI